MSLKLKLISCISAFVLVLGLLFVGVWAVNQGSVQMGGSLSFTATDVYARVTGEISGAGVGDKTLPAIEFSASDENPDQSGWQNLDLEFNAAGEPITIKVMVENLATDRSLTVNLKDNFSSEQGGLIKDVKNGDSKYTGTNVVLNASTGSGTSTTTFTITLSLSSKNNSLSDTTFGYTINLYDASYVPPLEEITGFSFSTNDDGTATLAGYTGTDTEVVIPSSYSIKMVDGVKTYIEGNDYLVTAIGSYAFNDCSGLTSITIPEEVTTIGSSAFDGCSGLETMNYLGTLESWCAIEFGKGNSNPTSYTRALYIQGEEITEIVVPEGTETLATTFIGCENITSVSLPNSLTTIGNRAFHSCSSLTSVDLSDCTSLTTIGDWAFYNCSGLTGITIPKGVTLIGRNPFVGCSGLETIVVEEGNSEYHIDGNCLIETNSKTLIVGRNNSVIPTDGSVTSVGDSAFALCSGLTNITIPNSVTTIGTYAFSGCTSLISITIKATTPPTLGSSAIPSNVTNIYVPAASVEAYESGWSSYASKISAIA